MNLKEKLEEATITALQGKITENNIFDDPYNIIDMTDLYTSIQENGSGLTPKKNKICLSSNGKYIRRCNPYDWSNDNIEPFKCNFEDEDNFDEFVKWIKDCDNLKPNTDKS